jgi:hypothetical protein
MNLRELRKSACLSNWYPQIENLPTPKTEIVKTDLALASMLDGKTPKGFEMFKKELLAAISKIGGFPCFLRTGQTSGKHSWLDTCFLAFADKLEQHIFNLIEFSECVDIFGLDYDVWVVREILPTEPIFTKWRGFPVTKERRYFVQDGQVLCHHPYWFEGVFENLEAEKLEKLREINTETESEIEELSELAAKFPLDGAWSIDFLWTKRGWYLIDAAPGEASWHYPNCPNI